ncbi:hypothetical protein P389DRAFT_164727 [Cystobasidium minutum MCA 4210]|uniref:uncharacterized protein n=1 Tax=Cystobasidium minutum MCA 4210 TaxID=1397322 RepID=UPI0034CE0EC3|eukprot:jgi/Rhomi1/164727/fgenesh1_kg.1_\
MAPSLRLSYAATIPFKFKTHLALCTFWVVGFCGLLVWNFLASAKGLQCTSYASPSYDAATCEKTPLEFANLYYTRPISNAASTRTIGTFPWTPLGFGTGNNGPIDYTILNLNWTADPLKCVMYEQFLVLHLDSEGSTVNSCYYCGPDLRVLCSTVDSERAQVPDQSATSYVSILDSFNQLSVYAHQIVTTAQEGATVGSVRINTHRKVDGLESGVLPYDRDEFMVTLGSTMGSFPIFANSSNAGVARVAEYARTLSTIVEQATSLDLQPADAASSSANQRTLQVSYLCRACVKRYKPTLEIIALLITGVFGVLAPAFALAKLVAEWTSDAPQPLNPHDPNSLLAAANAGGGSNSNGSAAGGSGSGPYKPGAASPGLPPQMQHSNSYNMVPVQPYSPGLDQQRLSGGAVAGPYPSYQQPYGQA